MTKEEVNKLFKNLDECDFEGKSNTNDRIWFEKGLILGNLGQMKKQFLESEENFVNRKQKMICNCLGGGNRLVKPHSLWSSTMYFEPQGYLISHYELEDFKVDLYYLFKISDLFKEILLRNNIKIFHLNKLYMIEYDFDIKINIIESYSNSLDL